jgi:hypothetical protein
MKLQKEAPNMSEAYRQYARELRLIEEKEIEAQGLPPQPPAQQ